MFQLHLVLSLMLLAIQGAALLLSTPSPVARHVVEVAFDRKGSGKQLVSMPFCAHVTLFLLFF